MRQLAAVLLFCFSLSAVAQEGYEIKVTLKPFKNQYIYFGHYYGKQLPIIDSVKLNEKSEGVFRGKKKLGGGIYLIGYPDRATNFDILIDKNQRFSIIGDTANIQKVQFVNSPDNVNFKAYQQFMTANGKKLDGLIKELQANPQDSSRLHKEIDATNAAIKNYRSNIITKQSTTLLATLLKAMKEPEVPRDHPEAKKDTLFAYKYFKKHYWDDVKFWDDRLTKTPFFEPRLDKYFETLIYPNADSVIKEIDWMMGYASASEEMQRFLLVKFVNRYLNMKYMWEDKVFVHLFEKYFAQKNYTWLNEKGRKTITDRAYSLMANIMGNPAQEVDLPDLSGARKNLYSVESPYVLVAIWDPTCGHCKEVLPRLDSFYTAKWKGMGLKVYSLAKETDGTKKDWTDFIDKHKLQDWVNVYYSKQDEKARVDAGIPSYSQLYDVQSFPTLYLLDKDKRIIAKKVTHQQIDEILSHRVKNQ
jgi:thiol-disulfide isomerase/thioredoxin